MCAEWAAGVWFHGAAADFSRRRERLRFYSRAISDTGRAGGLSMHTVQSETEDDEACYCNGIFMLQWHIMQLCRDTNSN